MGVYKGGKPYRGKRIGKPRAGNPGYRPQQTGCFGAVVVAAALGLALFVALAVAW